MTVADEPVPDRTGEPVRSLEVERTYEVDATTALPDWHDIPGVVEVMPEEIRELDARYLDTEELHLARAGYALRRRTGGHDAGWHIKGPLVDGARVESAWPLGLDPDEDVPDSVRAEIERVTDAALHPLARVENSRVPTALRGEDGGLIAEFVDDHVRGTDLRGDTVREWREWEVELGPAAPADPGEREELFAAIERAITAVGGRPAGPSSKLGRTLGR
ncbi:CYTH domain-containing protein [Microbacterium sp. 1P10UB]|uniref:CYTH domain-containing protein n=1 Tax=unclassified Microbacterium TaxID=2609290 RepID=UPI0039A0C5B5